MPEKQEVTKWLTTEELAAELRVPKGTIYAWNKRRTGPKPVRIGRHNRYSRKIVDAWISARIEAAAGYDASGLDAGDQ